MAHFSLQRNIDLMEVEVKIRLGSKADHDKVLLMLGGIPRVTHEQVNVFFDGTEKQLGSTKSVMRIRNINNGLKYVLTLKGNAVLKEGISRVEETEEALEPEMARNILKQPNMINTYSSKSKLLTHIIDTFAVTQWQIIGQFETIRKKFDWNGYVVELDETKFSFCTGYEIEIETLEPEKAKAEMENLLMVNNVAFSNTTKNKFVSMITGTL